MVPEPGDLRRFLLLALAPSSAACGAGPQSAAVEVERTDSAGIEWASGSIAVEPDGTVNVFDFGKLGLVRFDAEGRTLDVRRVEALPHGGRFEIVDGSILLQLSEFDAARDAGADLLALISESGDSTILARFSSPPMRPVSFSCGVAISGMAQLFAPSLVWAARAERLAVNTGAASSFRSLVTSVTSSAMKACQRHPRWPLHHGAGPGAPARPGGKRGGTDR